MGNTVTFTIEEIADIAQDLLQWSDILSELNEELGDEVGVVGLVLEKLIADGVIAEPVTLPGEE